MERHYVLGFCRDIQTNQLLLIEKTHPPFQAGKLNGIGGKLEKYETIHDAMVREFKEETGLLVSDWYHLH